MNKVSFHVFCENKKYILDTVYLQGFIYLVKKDLTANVKVDAFCTKVFEIEFSAKVGNIFHLICSFVAHHVLYQERSRGRQTSSAFASVYFRQRLKQQLLFTNVSD